MASRHEDGWHLPEDQEVDDRDPDIERKFDIEDELVRKSELETEGEQYTWLDIVMGLVVILSAPAMYALAFWQHWWR